MMPPSVPPPVSTPPPAPTARPPATGSTAGATGAARGATLAWPVRAALCAGGIPSLILAAGYTLQLPWAVGTWPWPDGRLSYLFIASILAAIGVAVLWIGGTDDAGALPAGALNLVVMLGGIAGYLVATGEAGRPAFHVYAAGAGALALGNLVLCWWGLRLPVRDHRPLPRTVRVSYVAFAAILVVVGGALLVGVRDVLPWPLRPDTAAVFGWVYVGDAFYFLYAAARPYWAQARVQLWSFLAYDLVLIGPFLGHLAAVRPEHRASLFVYLAVLVYSAGLATYYLLLDQRTRVWGRGGRSAV